MTVIVLIEWVAVSLLWTIPLCLICNKTWLSCNSIFGSLRASYWCFDCFRNLGVWLMAKNARDWGLDVMTQGMGRFSIWRWIVVLTVLGVVVGIPAWFGFKIAGRAGFSRASGLLFEASILGLVLLWVWIFRKWPSIEGQRPAYSTVAGR